MILSTTLCYPNPAFPLRGVFVERRLREVARVVDLRVVVPVPWFPILAPAVFDLREAADAAHAGVAYVRMFYLPGALKRLDAGFFGRALERGMPAHDVDLIDAHFEYPDGVGAWEVARRRGIPFICTLRGKLLSQAEYASRRRQMVSMLRSASALIAVSRDLANRAQQLAGGALPIHVIPNGVDADVFRPPADRPRLRSEMGWSEGARYVVSVGHMQELKGFHRLVEVWPEVRRRAGDARLVLIGGEAGEPGYIGRIRGLIDGLRLRGVVEIVGALPPEEVARRLGAADLFALASRSEGWCNSLAEALACGCPAVVTDVGGNREVMNDWGVGRLVTFGDPDALVERIVDALESDWDRRRIAEHGGRRSWRQVAGECVDVFEKALGRRLRPAPAAPPAECPRD